MTQIIPVRRITVAIPAPAPAGTDQVRRFVPDRQVAYFLAPVRVVAEEADPGRRAGSQTLAHHAACAIRHLCDAIEHLAADPGREAGREDLRRAVRKVAVASRLAADAHPDREAIAMRRVAPLTRDLDRVTLHIALGDMAGQPWRLNAARPAVEALRRLVLALALTGGGPGALLDGAGLRARTASARARHRLSPGQPITEQMRCHVQERPDPLS
jgi:hypothetical protein